MPVNSENKYLQSQLENLVATYETEINYCPVEVELDPLQISAKDIQTLLLFVAETRKRLFLFKIPGKELINNQLAITARRSILNQTAETILQSTSSEPKINPLKLALNSSAPTLRAGIQIQKSFVLPKQPSVVKDAASEIIKSIPTPDLVLNPINLPEFRLLTKQLEALGIKKIHEVATQKIKEHPHAFTDGIIPNNLPKGFYINKEMEALCFTNTPLKLPSSLAPVLEKQKPLPLPTIELAKILLPSVSDTTLKQLFNSENNTTQKNALFSVLPSCINEVQNFLQSLQPASLELVLVPYLTKLFLLGGETHTSLITRLLQTCLNKKLSLDFLKDPDAQNDFLSPRGIKNLQKLLQLPAEQKDLWNTLTLAHLKNSQHHFDFNVFFEAYTQIFLPRISEKNLTLPHPCPIKHEGHLLITLNRILEVLEHAENPQEQCLSLTDLNWGPTGVHYAMIQAPEAERTKQVAACMKFESQEDIKTSPKLIQTLLEKEPLDQKSWLFRYMGQHWKKEIRLTDIQDLINEIQNQILWTPLQKNQLLFILACTFSDKTPLNAQQWKQTLKTCATLMQPLSENERSDLLQALCGCYSFKPTASLIQIQKLIVLCLELKNTFPNKQFKNEILIPLISFLENEGFDVFNTLQERIQKTDVTPSDRKYTLMVISSFTTLITRNRTKLQLNVIKLLAKLNEPELNQTHIDDLTASIQSLNAKKGEEYCNALLSTLSQINNSKSQTLPNVKQIQLLICASSDSTESIPAEYNNLDKQETWFKNQILEKNYLPGCVLGNGDISKLDDLLVDGLVDAIKKRSEALKIDRLKASLLKNLQSNLIPDQLKMQLNQDLIPLFDAFNDLINLLQTPNPKFEDVLQHLRFFEETKPRLLDGNYSVAILGQSKGEYILSYLLSGKRKETDTTTGTLFEIALSKLHSIIASEISNFFANEKNRSIVKDLDAKTTLAWMAKFNETHALTFLFKEELVHKKVLPALKKTLLQLNTQDPIFEKSILDAAAELDENKPSDCSLQEYKTKIEAISNYLNLLIDIKDKAPVQFNTLYKQLQTGELARLNYTQKQTLVNKIPMTSPESLELYLKLTTQALAESPGADTIAIERSINGLVALFELTDLDPDTQSMFFKMSMSHNLKSTSPFPLASLNEFKRSNLQPETKSLIMRQIIQLLSHMTQTDSPDLIHGLVQQSQNFLSQNPDQAPLCSTLLKRVSIENLSRDLGAYPSILHQLALLTPENRTKIGVILTGLASNKKDDTVNLPTLLEISKGLGRRSSSDLNQVLKLFATPPYPIAQALNSALLAHGSEKLQAYCLSFDTNPFTKTGETRELQQQFATDRIKESLLSLKDLMHGADLPHSLQLELAKQLTYIETLGYTDPLNPNEYQKLKKLTAYSRHDLKERASTLLLQLRDKKIAADELEPIQLELLAYLREIYFRATGLFPNSTQILMLLLSLKNPATNLLMSIKTGEGKSLITPMLAVLQWAQGGTVDMCTANRTLLGRDYENNCEPFFKFLGIESTLIQSNSSAEEYKLNAINCSTLEDMSLFRLAVKEAKQERVIQSRNPIHLVLDECDDALLDQTTLYKLVAENASTEIKKNNPAEWIYPLAYQFIHLPAFRNLDRSAGKIWDEEEDLEQFRLYLNKEINDKYSGDANKQNFLMASSNTQLKQWINASCKAATLVENKHFIVQTLKEKDHSDNESRKKIVCVPLVRSTPKTGSIFTNGLQHALQARLIIERKEHAQYVVIDADPPVLSSQSARGLIQFYQNTQGRLLGISGTPGDPIELQYLTTLLGTQAIGVAPYAGDKRTKHAPEFTFSRKESILAIKKAIETIQCPITKPTMEINPETPIQTFEEREAFIDQTKGALEQWSHTQTQPILIVCEDFDEAQSMSLNLDDYKKIGFKIQVVTGKESPEKLERIIKQAGQANTITIGTAMLARGIDINPGDHPQGLFVIQTYTDSKRMTTQIGGRAARNGKPGQWLPIYEVTPPQGVFNKILYYIFPWYRHKVNQQSVEQIQNEIKLQATIDRLYTQAIDQAQHTVMQQIHAWESLLLELYPNDPKLNYELYQWRETLLSELSHIQETIVSQSTIESSIAQFKKSLGTLWETAREEKWATKGQQAHRISPDQNIRFNYLKQLDLAQELTIQAKLQQKSTQFSAGTQALVHQNIETIIRDKAGAVLNYTSPPEQLKRDLELAQARQLLPNLIGELCALYPQAIKKLTPKNNSQLSFFLPALLNSLIEKVIEQKNKALLRSEDKEQITQAIIQLYQNELLQADEKSIQILLQKIKPLILDYSKALEKASLIDQFKTQGLILTFAKLYQHSGLTLDDQLNELKTSYDNEIMKKMATHLLNEFAWVKTSPEPLHAYLERAVAKEAAFEIYSLAEEVNRSPNDPNKIRALYTGLQEHRVKLQNKYLFSVTHSSPRHVIHTALAAIESLNSAPHCDRVFQNLCHDNVLSEYHVTKFRSCLEATSRSFNNTNDPVWEHLNDILLKMSTIKDKNQIHIIAELYETTVRYSTYNAYRPYTTQLKALKAQLSQSMNALNNPTGLKQDYQSSLFIQKTSQFAALFQTAPEQVRIQKACDGIKSYIEVQIENPSLKEGFAGYKSTFLDAVENEKARIGLQKSALNANKPALIALSELKALEGLPPANKLEFEKLFSLKSLLSTDWSKGLDDAIVSELPESLQSLHHHLKQLSQQDWTINPIDRNELKLILSREPNQEFETLCESQNKFNLDLEDIQNRKQEVTQQIAEEKKKLLIEESKIQTNVDRIQTPECGFMENIELKYKNYVLRSVTSSIQNQVSSLEKKLTQINEEALSCQKQLKPVNQSLDIKRKEFLSTLVDQAKQALHAWLHETSKKRIETIEQELNATDTTFVSLKNAESQKSSYQTRRFFSSSELLNYEASLAQEEAQIPLKPVDTKIQTKSYFEQRMAVFLTPFSW